MIFEETAIRGVFLVRLEPSVGPRGSFARTFCRREFAEAGLNPHVEQCNVSMNPLRGTLRGLHLQYPPSAEAKLIRCTRGAMFDVLVDVRPDSPTHLEWVGVELTGAGTTSLYAPEGLAHGFVTLDDDTEITYLMSAPYVPELAGGYRWDDPAFGIDWPIAPRILSDRDKAWADYRPDPRLEGLVRHD